MAKSPADTRADMRDLLRYGINKINQAPMAERDELLEELVSTVLIYVEEASSE